MEISVPWQHHQHLHTLPPEGPVSRAVTMDYSWRILFLLALATGKECPTSKPEDRTRSIQDNFIPSCSSPQVCILRSSWCSLGLRWSQVHPWRSHARHLDTPLLTTICTGCDRLQEQGLIGWDRLIPKMVPQGIRRSSRAESPWWQTHPQAQTIWSWAVWELRTQPCTTLRDTVWEPTPWECQKPWWERSCDSELRSDTDKGSLTSS